MKPPWTVPAGLFLLLTAPALAAEPADYVRDVKPLLADRCTTCHGADKQRGGLRLDTATAILRGGNNGPAVVPGKAADSRLIRAVTAADGVKVMPPKEPRLSNAEVALLRAWVEQGARAPADEPPAPAARSKHWAFQPVTHPDPPPVKDAGWVRSPIDHFILARLEKDGLTPAPEADRVTLIRRVSLDLLGLPPSLAEVDAFVNDPRPDAYERLVDRLLADPHYGERQGRHWLDLARYADSNGFNIDAPRSLWKYRDWVIDAFNADLPFDRFTIEQLAGDLLPNATASQKVATGFHRNTLINQEGGIDVEQFRVESVVDRVNTTGTVWLGLSVGCAQCHDHKFDPITQREYYQLYAFLNNADEPTLELPTPEQAVQRKEVRGKLAEAEKRLKALDDTSDAKVAAWELTLTAEAKAQLPADVQAALALADNSRDAKQKALLLATVQRIDDFRLAVGGLGNPLAIGAAAHVELASERAALLKKVAELKKKDPDVVTTMVLQERSKPRESHVHLGGDFLRKGAQVEPGVPAALHPLHPLTPGPSPPSTGERGEKTAPPNRLDLARWLVDPANSLTPRVTVNRAWQQFFGLGLVETENDFGIQGTPPSHPELLDWLAAEFMARGWSVKQLHRLIVTSATYRQASKVRPELAADPRNRLLGRQTRLRLEAEAVRDVALTASGLLSEKIGGPSVFPPQPDGVYRFTQVQRIWTPNTGPDRYRRGMYTHFWRSAPYPSLLVFDAPESTTSCTRRNRSNTPLQALTLLNDQAFFEFAQGLAARVLRDSKADDAERLRYAFRLCVARSPTDREMARLQRLVATIEPTPEELKVKVPDGLDAKQFVVWTTVARVLLNLDEFITRE
jgi:mono/diheme cytochrome c family protein